MQRYDYTDGEKKSKYFKIKHKPNYQPYTISEILKLRKIKIERRETLKSLARGFRLK